MYSRKICKKLQNWHFWVLFSNYGFHNWHIWPTALRNCGDTSYKLLTTISSRWNTSYLLKKQMSHICLLFVSWFQLVSIWFQFHGIMNSPIQYTIPWGGTKIYFYAHSVPWLKNTLILNGTRNTLIYYCIPLTKFIKLSGVYHGPFMVFKILKDPLGSGNIQVLEKTHKNHIPDVISFKLYDANNVQGSSAGQ